MNIVMPHKSEIVRQPLQRERPVVSHKNDSSRQPPTDLRERVDMFGRTIRKDVPRSPTPRSTSRSPVRTHTKRKFSLSPSSKSRSHSDSRSFSGSSASRSRSRSYSKSRSRSGSESASGSGSRSRSRSGSSASPQPIPVTKSPPISKKKEKLPRKLPTQGTVSYGESVKAKSIDPVKIAGQKQQIKLTLKKPGPVRPIDKTVLGEEDDSGESDTDGRILKKRKLDNAPIVIPPSKAVKPVAPVVTTIVSQTSTSGSKKPSAARREELLKQLRAVEDAIARKRSKPLG